MSPNSFIALVAAIPLVLCMATIWWSVRANAVGRRHTLLVFGCLCAALTATLVIFALFRSTTASGTVLGMTLGGAGAFVLLVWVVGLRATARAARRDAIEARVARKAEAVRHPVGPHRAARQGQEIFLYQVSGTPDGEERYVGVVTGDIRRVQDVDVWVNSENTEMAMSRVHDFSISGVLRYEAARRDAGGSVVEDHLADALAQVPLGGRPVAPGTAVVTGSGELRRRNGVWYVIHVAAVEGAPGAGFRQVPDVGRCVYSALVEAERLDKDGEPVRTVLFPLLGTGQGGADPHATARSLIPAAADYLATTHRTRLQTVYFLAYTDGEMAACTAVLDTCPQLRRRQRGGRRRAGRSCAKPHA